MKEKYAYRRYRLGANYSKEQTEFRVQTTKTRDVKLQLYKTPKDKPYAILDMKDAGDGIFERVVRGDLDGVYYDYLLDKERVANDIYAVASSINSEKSCVVDLRDTDPKGFRRHIAPPNSWKDAIIYEMNIKDFTADPSSGVRKEYRGKFLGACEENTGDRVKTGLDHLTELGVTHVHLMPVFDFWTVDERPERFFDDDNYNWGYDPENYNIPEGSYATDPYDPKARIREYKQMIQKFHEHGISVVMDMVYNHTFRTKDSNFNKLMPGCFYRMTESGEFSNGSGCGNELKTENEPVRNFIIDSLLYYMKEYKIDGFRFDLMALMDRRTMDKIVEVLREENPRVLIYGEPWAALPSTLPHEDMVFTGAQYNKEFSIFNSEFRDALKGDNDGIFSGYVQGEFGYKQEVETGIAGSIHFDEYHRGFACEPWESVNYFNSHDNLIIQDKLRVTTKDKSLVPKRTKLLFGILLTSYGLPFFHAGNEFMRTKDLIPNTYNHPLSVNAIDWKAKQENIDVFRFVRDLISFRRNNSKFFSYNADEIRDHLGFMSGLPDSLIGYGIFNGRNILLVFHNAGGEQRVNLATIAKLIRRRGEYEILSCTKIFENGRIEKPLDLNKDIVLPACSTTMIGCEVAILETL